MVVSTIPAATILLARRLERLPLTGLRPATAPHAAVACRRNTEALSEALSPRVAPPGTMDMGETLGLPPLPTRSVVLQSRPSEPAARRALRTFASALRATAGH
jgi:hypothetical protein